MTGGAASLSFQRFSSPPAAMRSLSLTTPMWPSAPTFRSASVIIADLMSHFPPVEGSAGNRVGIKLQIRCNDYTPRAIMSDSGPIGGADVRVDNVNIISERRCPRWNTGEA